MKRTFPTEFKFAGYLDSNEIVQMVATVFEVDFNAIFTRTKYRPVADARQVSAVLLNKIKGITHESIAWLLERDVSIVSYCQKAVKDKYEGDKTFAEKFDKVLEVIERDSDQTSINRTKIMDKVEDLWDECFKRNTGSNEAELEFREEITNWILKLEQGIQNCPKCGKEMTKLIPRPYCCPDINCATRK